jgi:hypothetical protein
MCDNGQTQHLRGAPVRSGGGLSLWILATDDPKMLRVVDLISALLRPLALTQTQGWFLQAERPVSLARP